MQWVRRVWRGAFRFDPQPADDLVREFAAAYYQADPAPVEEFRR
ncbi:hypothetical protein [Nocardia sp. NPDC046763]